jgi:hypothetical protein
LRPYANGPGSALKFLLWEMILDKHKISAEGYQSTGHYRG